MAGIFDLDDLDNIDDEEEKFDFSEEDFETNVYLKNSAKALELIGTIIPCEKRNYGQTNRVNRIDEMLDRELLGSLKYVRLSNESQLQLELSNFGKKLYEGRKYQVIKNKALVGVGGKFSAGKSKFINSLLKTEELLPENQNPTTSIATYIVGGEKRIILLYTNDNKECEISLDALNALTHSFYEKYKIGFSSFVDCVIVNEPNMPYKDIVFLDTPGYSKADDFEGLESGNGGSDRQKAQEQLSGVDFLIWLIDIENGEISVPDVEFLKSIKIDTPILFVLNKSDKKTDEDIKKTIEKVKGTAIANGLSVYGVTAYSSLNEGNEWNGNRIISDFLEKVSSERKSKLDMRVRLKEIEEIITKDIDGILKSAKCENDELYRIICESNNVIEIKSLVDLYGESIEEYRQILLCKTLHERNVEEIERSINKHYEE